MSRGIDLKTRTNAKADDVAFIVVLDKQGKYRPLTVQELKVLLNKD